MKLLCFYRQLFKQHISYTAYVQKNLITLILFLFFQILKFTDAFYAPPVVMVSPRLSYHNNNSRFSASGTCNAVTAWIQVTYMKLGAIFLSPLRPWAAFLSFPSNLLLALSLFQIFMSFKESRKVFFVLFFPYFSNQPVHATVSLSKRPLVVTQQLR